MEQHNNILGTMPVRKLVLTMSSPIMLSMLMGAIYNLVDVALQTSCEKFSYNLQKRNGA